MSYVGILVTFVLVNNFVLTHFLGLCPIVGTTRSTRAAIGIGVAATFVMTIGSLVTWSIRTLVLAPLGVDFLQTFVFVLVITAIGHYLELAMEKAAPALHRAIGRYIPLIATNCIVLGIALVVARGDYSALESLVAGASAGIGFLLVAVIVSTIRERLETEWVPRAFRGVPIAFISTGLVALAFLAFDQALLRNLFG
jgi:Na+-translocating ferredoxin:NAD+ oxidoreductase subunit A